MSLTLEPICKELEIDEGSSRDDIIAAIRGMKEYSEDMRSRLERLGKEWEGPFEAIAALTWADYKRWKCERPF